jgi:hypothetical protein
VYTKAVAVKTLVVESPSSGLNWATEVRAAQGGLRGVEQPSWHAGTQHPRGSSSPWAAGAGLSWWLGHSLSLIVAPTVAPTGEGFSTNTTCHRSTPALHWARRLTNQCPGNGVPGTAASGTTTTKLYLEQTKVFIAGDFASSEYISMGQNKQPCSREPGANLDGRVKGLGDPINPSGAKKTMGLAEFLACVLGMALSCVSLPTTLRGGGPGRTGCQPNHGAPGVEAGALLRPRSLVR